MNPELQAKYDNPTHTFHPHRRYDDWKMKIGRPEFVMCLAFAFLFGCGFERWIAA